MRVNIALACVMVMLAMAMLCAVPSVQAAHVRVHMRTRNDIIGK